MNNFEQNLGGKRCKEVQSYLSKIIVKDEKIKKYVKVSANMNISLIYHLASHNVKVENLSKTNYEIQF